MNNDEFGELRSLLAKPPSEELFETILNHLGTTRVHPTEVEYVASHLSEWPDDVERSAPEHLVTPRRPSPLLALCNSIDADTLCERERAHEELFDAPEFASIRHLDASYCLDRDDAVFDALVSSPNTHGLRSLTLEGWKLTDGHAADLAAAESLGGLVHLDLTHNELGLDGLDALLRSRALTRLESLNLRGNSIDAPADDPERALSKSRLSNLQTLVLTGNTVRSRPSALLPRSLRSLRRLVLRKTRLDDAGLEDLRRWRSVGELTELDVAHNRITSAGAADLLLRTHTPRMRTLTLSGANLSALSGALEGRRADPAIEPLFGLDLVWTSIEPEGLGALCASGALDGVRELAVMFCSDIECDSLERMGDEDALHALDSLFLAYTGVSARGARALARAPGFERLRELNLSNTPLGDAGVVALCDGWRGDLEILDLDATGLSHVGVGALADTPEFSGLTSLCLANNDIGDRGAHVLANASTMSGLGRLDLMNCHISDEGALALARSRCLENLGSLSLAKNAMSPGVVRQVVSTLRERGVSITV